ncbi:MAG: hypothetical protein MK137_04790 [Rickettsiales bacterium]|nr:hypothetical protein [Rickettsiales bacterium]
MIGHDIQDEMRGGDGNDMLFGDLVHTQLSLAIGSIDFETVNTDTKSNDILHGGTGNDHIIAGGGDDILDGGSGDDYLEANAGHDTLKGSGGDDIFHFGLSEDDAYKELQNYEEAQLLFNTSIGHDFITDFQGAGATSGDIISLNWEGFLVINDILEVITYEDTNAIITIDSENSITLLDIAPNSLTMHDFLIE